MAWRKKSQNDGKNSESSDAVSRVDSSPPGLFRRALHVLEQHLEQGASFFLGPDAAAGQGAAPDKGAVSSGSMAFDHISGCNGWPRGRISEVVGPPGSGKTTLALAAIAQVQRAGGVAAFVDVERALDRLYAERAGVDLNALLVIHPVHGEQAIQIVSELLAANAVDMIVVDSVAALVPQRELEGSTAAPKNALAKMMSTGLRTLNAALGQSTAALLMLNQLRTHSFDDEPTVEVSAGGDALKYYAAIRVDIRTTETHRRVVGKTLRAVGQRARLRVLKSKVGRPHEEVHIQIHFGRGLDRAAECVDMALAAGILEREDGAYAYRGNPIGPRGVAVEAVAQDRELFDAIRRELHVVLQAGNEPANDNVPLEVARAGEFKRRTQDDAVSPDDTAGVLSFVN